MSSAFFLGLPSSLEAAPFASTSDLYRQVGGNTGNLAFAYAVHSQVAGTGRTLSWEGLSAAVCAEGDIGVMPCANQLGTHADMGWVADRLKPSSIRLVAIGLGGQFPMNDRKPRLPKGTLEWLSQVAMRAPAPGYPNISVRGTRSLEALAHYGFDKHAVVLGCPSLFINPNPELGASIAKRLGRINRIAVAAGHQEWTELATLEASLARIVTRTGGSYIAQSEFEMMALARADFAQLSRADLLACRDYVAPEMDLDEFVQWSHRYATVFFHVPAWIEHYRHFDFVIGTRIHGVMLALQAGTPALCITHDSRTLEFCQSMGLPYVEASEVARGIDIGDIRDLYKFDAAEFDRNRRSLGKRYVEFLVQNGLHVSEALRPFA